MIDGSAHTRELKKNFDRERLALSDRIRGDDLLSPAFRIVGGELASRLSFNSGFADADQNYLAKKLGLSLRTVKMAVKALQLAGHFEVVRPGRRSSNRYRPIFETRQVQNLPLPETPQVQNLPLPETPQVQNLHLPEAERCKKGRQRCKKRPPGGAKFAP